MNIKLEAKSSKLNYHLNNVNIEQLKANNRFIAILNDFRGLLQDDEY